MFVGLAITGGGGGGDRLVRQDAHGITESPGIHIGIVVSSWPSSSASSSCCGISSDGDVPLLLYSRRWGSPSPSSSSSTRPSRSSDLPANGGDVRRARRSPTPRGAVTHIATLEGRLDRVHGADGLILATVGEHLLGEQHALLDHTYEGVVIFAARPRTTGRSSSWGSTSRDYTGDAGACRDHGRLPSHLDSFNLFLFLLRIFGQSR